MPIALLQVAERIEYALAWVPNAPTTQPILYALGAGLEKRNRSVPTSSPQPTLRHNFLLARHYTPEILRNINPFISPMAATPASLLKAEPGVNPDPWANLIFVKTSLSNIGSVVGYGNCC
jgi:hypothetical protein